MKISKNLYSVIKQIHLYSSLLTVALLLMYIITSYMMIYHDSFKVDSQSTTATIALSSMDEVNDENWPSFLKHYQINGRKAGERFDESGNMIRNYYSATGNFKVTLFKDSNKVEIVTTKLNLSGSIIGLHRLRGYGGPLLYNIYAFMLDLVGISLIIFAVSGVILWFKLLQYNKIAWVIFILGFIYVGTVIIYLNLH